jgi:hypothetical protein
MRDEDIPSHICREVVLAAADLGRGGHAPDQVSTGQDCESVS